MARMAFAQLHVVHQLCTYLDCKVLHMPISQLEILQHPLHGVTLEEYLKAAVDAERSNVHNPGNS